MTDIAAAPSRPRNVGFLAVLVVLGAAGCALPFVVQSPLLLTLMTQATINAVLGGMSAQFGGSRMADSCQLLLSGFRVLGIKMPDTVGRGKEYPICFGQWIWQCDILGSDKRKAVNRKTSFAEKACQFRT